MVYQQRTINTFGDELLLADSEEEWFEFLSDQLARLEFESRFVDVTIDEAIEIVTGG